MVARNEPVRSDNFRQHTPAIVCIRLARRVNVKNEHHLELEVRI